MPKYNVVLLVYSNKQNVDDVQDVIERALKETWQFPIFEIEHISKMLRE
jgi:hypothetical protein